MNKKKILKHIGKKIREARKMKGLSQEELALESEFDRSYIGRVERGERNLSIYNLCRLAESLKTNPSFFIEDLDLSNTNQIIDN